MKIYFSFFISVQAQAAWLLHDSENPSSFYFIALPSLKCDFLCWLTIAAWVLDITSVLPPARRGEIKSEAISVSIHGPFQKLYLISTPIQLAQRKLESIVVSLDCQVFWSIWEILLQKEEGMTVYWWSTSSLYHIQGLKRDLEAQMEKQKSKPSATSYI